MLLYTICRSFPPGRVELATRVCALHVGKILEIDRALIIDNSQITNFDALRGEPQMDGDLMFAGGQPLPGSSGNHAVLPLFSDRHLLADDILVRRLVPFQHGDCGSLPSFAFTVDGPHPETEQYHISPFNVAARIGVKDNSPLIVWATGRLYSNCFWEVHVINFDDTLFSVSIARAAEVNHSCERAGQQLRTADR
jgi:hypothetical protein